MLFLQFVQYLLSFAGTPKNEIPGAALELCQLKLKQFSPDILKFSTKHEVILLLSTVLWFLALVCLYLMQARVDWVLIIFGTQVIKKKWPVRPMFPDYFSVSYEYSLNFRVLSIVLKNQQQLNNSCIDKNNESILEEIYLFHDSHRNLTIPNSHQRLNTEILRSLAKKIGHGAEWYQVYIESITYDGSHCN